MGDRTSFLAASSAGTAPSQATASQLYCASKRAFDIVFSAIVLILFLPLLGAIALAVRLESAGPVFFRQRRVGRNGVPFEMLKFRSMSRGADGKRALVARGRQEGPVFKRRDDPRVTRLGRFLRRTSLDEFPQFLNVLLGQMSLVGPRPLPLQDVEEWEAFNGGAGPQKVTAWLALRHTVRPGLSGLWQVRGRSLLPFADWMHYDVLYVQTRGWRLDLKILALTPIITLLGRGAV